MLNESFHPIPVDNRESKAYSKHMNKYSYERVIKVADERIEICEVQNIHAEIVEAVMEQMPAEEILYDLAELFKVFGDSTRIKILYVLLESEMCVCDIANLLGMTQSAISHQLRVLKQSRLVKFRREGKSVMYSLVDDHVRSVIETGMEHVCE